jgi:hypothetical protein
LGLLSLAFWITAYGITMTFGLKNVGIACAVPLADKEIRLEIQAFIVEWHG